MQEVVSIQLVDSLDFNGIIRAIVCRTIPNKLGAVSMLKEVVICEYSKEWVQAFQAERDKLLLLLEAEEVKVEHFGSTSVPGLSAKPIIDILIGFKDFSLAERSIEKLICLNYDFIEAVSVPNGRLFFKKTPHTHHVHFVEYGTEHWGQPLIFRDYIRGNEEERNNYAQLKKELANRYRDNPLEYTNAKTSFINNILIKANY